MCTCVLYISPVPHQLEHFFEQRMSGSYVHANAFLMRFPRPVLASFMRVTRFFSGAVVAVLLVMTVLEVRYGSLVPVALYNSSIVELFLCWY